MREKDVVAEVGWIFHIQKDPHCLFQVQKVRPQQTLIQDVDEDRYVIHQSYQDEYTLQEWLSRGPSNGGGEAEAGTTTSTWHDAWKVWGQNRRLTRSELSQFLSKIALLANGQFYQAETSPPAGADEERCDPRRSRCVAPEDVAAIRVAPEDVARAALRGLCALIAFLITTKVRNKRVDTPDGLQFFLGMLQKAEPAIMTALDTAQVLKKTVSKRTATPFPPADLEVLWRTAFLDFLAAAFPEAPVTRTKLEFEDREAAFTEDLFEDERNVQIFAELEGELQARMFHPGTPLDVCVGLGSLGEAALKGGRTERGGFFIFQKCSWQFAELCVRICGRGRTIPSSGPAPRILLRSSLRGAGPEDGIRHLAVVLQE